MGRLDGKVAVVTGGSSGMALAGAKLFVEEGAHVFITGRRKDAVDDAVASIGRNVTGVQADSSNLADLDRLFDVIRREKGSVDVLWANAGAAREAALGTITEEHFDDTFGLNARGTLFTVQKALPLLNDGGSILMTGSIASVRGYPSWGVYAASKAALHAYARVWVAELKDRRIRVNVLTPGQVVAPGLETTFDAETAAAMEAREALIPRGSNGRPEEIATAALFLASDDSAFVNGQELIVDGGTTAV
ncbi:SDR family oxidoreductase [Mycobacterium yunnanensis]|uniref:SDR family oxidoreductase n=1 Tax=Mycobacterium yunnanensis TaxID=368477 RepID=A0A9X2Z064_9MYCO|nr:SDR family oxidoreductase [Mycobacterium yunnanensis]MCV7420596.1 SDR family oxidoreductase [Mycobacterium yunnanensis]